MSMIHDANYSRFIFSPNLLLKYISSHHDWEERMKVQLKKKARKKILACYYLFKNMMASHCFLRAWFCHAAELQEGIYIDHTNVAILRE